MFRRLIDRNNYIILEQSRKEISDRKTLNGCLQSVWLVLGPNMWCLETFTGSRCQVFVNRFRSHNSWRELRAASIARIFDLPWVGKSLNQSLKLGRNKVLFFVFRYMRFNLEKKTYQNTFISMKIGISFKAILSSVHKSACFRKQPANLACLLY